MLTFIDRCVNFVFRLSDSYITEEVLFCLGIVFDLLIRSGGVVEYS